MKMTLKEPVEVNSHFLILFSPLRRATSMLIHPTLLDRFVKILLDRFVKMKQIQFEKLT